MGLLALIILILLLLAVIVLVGKAWICRGQAAVGPSETPVNDVIHVRVSAITCRSFSVQFETADPVSEVFGTIDLAANVSQRVSASYASPETQHELTFSNGSVGLASDHWYAYSIMGRRDFDHDPGAVVTVPFVAKTASCCWERLLPFLYSIRRLQERPQLPGSS